MTGPNVGDISAGAWRTRGYVPHLESGRLYQHVTFRLFDSLPQSVLERLEQDLEAIPAAKRPRVRRERIEALMDAGYGSCILAIPDNARLVQDALKFFDGERYQLSSWVVMPNHVHVLLIPTGEWTVGRIVSSWKRFTAHRMPAQYRSSSPHRRPPRWQREYFDRYIRSQRHFNATVGYIHENPVKAGLVKEAKQWEWSSAWMGAPTSPSA